MHDTSPAHAHLHNRSLVSLYLLAGTACLGAFAIWRTTRDTSVIKRPAVIPSPRETVLPQLSREAIQDLPYPPDALTGARDVDSPYGTIRVYEFGPEGGQRRLLVHGISTPCVSMAKLAHKLVAKGCRVLLFDLFGRGYSSGPSPTTHRYDSALYASQILLCLQSSPISWPSFVIIGYSLGGALAADFTSYFPQLVDGLVLVAPGGLIRTQHISWKSKLLYGTSGLIPRSFVETLVAKRLWSGPPITRSVEPDATPSNASTTRSTSDPVYASSTLPLLPGRPNSTASAMVDWQIAHHQGFIPAFISSIQNAPIHDQHHRWRLIASNIERGIGRVEQVRIVLGELDPIIVKEEIMQDASEVLGEMNVRFSVVPGVGHDVVAEDSGADEIVNEAQDLLGRRESLMRPSLASASRYSKSFG